jgi:hypothetical protein
MTSAILCLEINKTLIEGEYYDIYNSSKKTIVGGSDVRRKQIIDEITKLEKIINICFITNLDYINNRNLLNAFFDFDTSSKYSLFGANMNKDNIHDEISKLSSDKDDTSKKRGIMSQLFNRSTEKDTLINHVLNKSETGHNWYFIKKQIIKLIYLISDKKSIIFIDSNSSMVSAINNLKENDKIDNIITCVLLTSYGLTHILFVINGILTGSSGIDLKRLDKAIQTINRSEEKRENMISNKKKGFDEFFHDAELEYAKITIRTPIDKSSVVTNSREYFKTNPYEYIKIYSNSTKQWFHNPDPLIPNSFKLYLSDIKDESERFNYNLEHAVDYFIKPDIKYEYIAIYDKKTKSYWHNHDSDKPYNFYRYIGDIKNESAKFEFNKQNGIDYFKKLYEYIYIYDRDTETYWHNPDYNKPSTFVKLNNELSYVSVTAMDAIEKMREVVIDATSASAVGGSKYPNYKNNYLMLKNKH